MTYQNAHEIEQLLNQALLDKRLAASGWDAALCVLDPVWQTDWIFDLDKSASEPIRMSRGWIQAPNPQLALDALRHAKLHCGHCVFDGDETSRRLQSHGLPQWQVEAAITFTSLTNASVFRGYGPEWQKLEERYAQDHEALFQCHRLLLTLARMSGTTPSAFDTAHHSESNQGPLVAFPKGVVGLSDTTAHPLPHSDATTGATRDDDH